MVRTRMAPSPTGEDLHIGNAYTALINYVFARKYKGKFIIRIEDTDKNREIKGSIERILSSFEWLGIIADESVKDGGPYQPYKQSERLGIYKKYAELLLENNKAYYCFCSSERLTKVREEQQKKGQPPMYDGYCKSIDLTQARKKISQGSKAVIRLNVPDSGETKLNDVIRREVIFQNKLIDDQILIKSDGYPTYHLAVVVDDYLMKISHVIRAEEWISSTPKHIILYQAFGWPLPVYAHLPLLRNIDRSKLSKRKNPVWVHWYKEEGFLPEAVVNYLLTLGWTHPQEKTIFSISEAIEKFSLEKVVTSAPIFDIKKLEWVNGEYLKKTQNSKLKTQIFEYYQGKYSLELIEKVIPLIRERIRKLKDIDGLIDFFINSPRVTMSDFGSLKLTKDIINNILKETINHLSDIDKWESDVIHNKGNLLVAKLNLKPIIVFQVLRIALSGKTVTPPLFESLEILGKDEVLLRIKNILGSLV